MKLRTGFTKKSLEESVKIRLNNKFTRISPRLNKESTLLYYENIKRYLDIFGKDNVLIIIFEEWINDPKNVLDEILEFLKINSSVKNLNNLEFKKYNFGWTPQSKLMKKLMYNKILINIIRQLIPKSFRNSLENNSSNCS